MAFEIANVSKETHNKSRHAQSQDNTEPAEDFLAVNYIEEPRHMIRNKKDGEFVEYGVESPNPTPPELGHSLSEVDHVAFMERRTMHTIQPVNQEMVGLYQGEEHSASIEQPPENVYHTNRYRHDVLDDLPPDYPHQGNQFTHANGLATFDPLYNGFIANVHPSASICPLLTRFTHTEYRCPDSRSVRSCQSSSELPIAYHRSATTCGNIQ